MASLSLKHIFKVYDGTTKAVNDFNMEIADKEFIVFVGPSGCGKSTTLRMIAGLEEISAGELRIDGVIVNDFEPKDRNIAMVFQNYALYPHMTVYENMAFSLRTMHMPSDEIRKKVMEAAEILGITQYLGRKPKALSGGQRQRVALGRAIVRSPKVFLLDEPLSNLDAKLRAAMRAEISRLHERLGTTFIYVTHDQVEAMTMGTRIVVMKDGFVQQIDTPINLYNHPDNLFVASFMGTPQMNFFDGTVKKDGDRVVFTLDCGAVVDMSYSHADRIPLRYMDGKHRIVFGVRHGGIRLYDPTAPDNDQWARARAVVSVVELLGDESLIYANLNVDTPDAREGAIVIKAHPDCHVRRGDIIDIAITRRKYYVFDKATERSIRRRVPEENEIPCSVRGGAVYFEGLRYTLPPALKADDAAEADLIVPVQGVHLGYGECRATISEIEDVEGDTLYVMKAGRLTLFALDKGKPRHAVGTVVNFDMDPRMIRIDACGIRPLNTINTLDGVFIKEKSAERRRYDFYMEMGGARLIPSAELCRKLFACKGTRIFHTPLLYEFDASAITVTRGGNGNGAPALRGVVSEILDYGRIKYARVTLGSAPTSETIIAAYDGAVGDEVVLTLDDTALTIKDRTIDMIIV